MSANNWTTCYACQTRRADADDERIAEQRKRIEDAYGQVSQEEYDSLRGRVESAIAEIEATPLSRTFREDFEIHGAETGVVTVSYGGSCTVCGYGTSFEERHPIEARELHSLKENGHG
ncbi:Uncharacterised protein [Mycobacteroides abscessus subsp. massiliense]|uniref:hypothetical protein n=1 Tax=Mycobacteroides abscessus TaxID=36809 RepID=UPI0009A68CBF|nr:hypothetical protein [Mycobacteroides abscessus]SLC05891.1 Uncharacterised protein [Mycobacteroides abscessus subsp. massiliense]